MDFKERFAQDGFVMAPGVFDDAELDEFGAAVDRAVERRSASISRPEAPGTEGPLLETELTLFLNLWEDDPVVRRWTFHQGLAGLVAEVLGAERLRILADQALYKEAGAPGTSKHQDVTRMPVEAARTLTAWIPFDGATVETGTLGYLPGTHLLGRGSHFDRLFGKGWSDDAKRELQREPVFVDVPRGGVILHHPCTFHLSSPNGAGVRRRAFGIVYFGDGARRESSYPHPSLDRAGIETGAVIEAASTPVAYPLESTRLPEPPEPLRDPPPGWPGERDRAPEQRSPQ